MMVSISYIIVTLFFRVALFIHLTKYIRRNLGGLIKYFILSDEDDDKDDDEDEEEDDEEEDDEEEDEGEDASPGEKRKAKKDKQEPAKKAKVADGQY